MTEKTNNPKQTWPTKKAMEQVYAMKLWGNNDTDFYSGYGSHDPEIITPYIAAITSFLNTIKTPLTICDLGCGDFNIGKQLVRHSKKYIAVDIVPQLIAHNRQKFNDKKLEFLCLDIATDELPNGDCVIIRQVLQHLSNAEVQHVLSKLSPYKYIILTEHIPEGDFAPNKDIISGQGTRLKKDSGLDILAPPFTFHPKKATILVTASSTKYKGAIITTLFEN